VASLLANAWESQKRIGTAHLPVRVARLQPQLTPLLMARRCQLTGPAARKAERPAQARPSGTAVASTDGADQALTIAPPAATLASVRAAMARLRRRLLLLLLLLRKFPRTVPAARRAVRRVRARHLGTAARSMDGVARLRIIAARDATARLGPAIERGMASSLLRSSLAREGHVRAAK
jgi:hypothetical protein